MILSENTIKQLLSALDNLRAHIVILDSRWNYTYVNKPALNRLNKPLDEIIGKNMWELHPHLIGTPFEKEARHTMSDHKVRELEDYYPNSDRWYLSRLVPAADGIMLQIFDVTRSKKTFETNTLLTEILDQALDASPNRRDYRNPRLK